MKTEEQLEKMSSTERFIFSNMKVTIDNRIYTKVATIVKLLELYKDFKTETVLVYKATFRGGFLIAGSINDILTSLRYDCEDMEEGEKVTIECILMSQKEYEALPEFDGFS